MNNYIISRDLIYSILIDEYTKCKNKYLEYKNSCMAGLAKMYYGSMDECIVLYARLSYKPYEECKKILEDASRNALKIYG